MTARTFLAGSRFAQREAWIEHIAPIASAAIAAALLALTPLWAFDWYRQPFTGMLLEPTLMVNTYQEAGWQVREAGVNTPDRLVAVGGQPVTTYAEYVERLAAAGGAEVRLTFEAEDGARRDLAVVPGRASPLALFRLFIVPYLVGWAFFATGLWVYRARGGVRAGRHFLIFASALAVTTSTFLDMETSHHAALAWALAIPAAAGAITALGLVFPEPSAIVRRWPAMRFVAWAPAVVLGGLTAREMLAPTSPLAYIPHWLDNYLYAGIAILGFLVSLVIGMYRASSPTVRQQSRVIVLGAALAFSPITVFLIPAALNIRMPFLIAVYFPPLAIFPLSVAYAIVRYRLLEIDRALNRGIAYVFTSAAVVLAYFFVLNGVSLALGRALAFNDPLVTAAFLLLLVVALNPLRDLSQRAVNRLFYRTPVDYRRSLERFSRDLTATHDLDRAFAHLADLLQSSLNPERLAIYFHDEAARAFRCHARVGDSVPASMPEDHALVRRLRQAGGAVQWDDGPTPDASPILRPGLTLCAPLQIEGRLTGWLALGAKKSGQPYTPDDLAFLDGLASQASLAAEQHRLEADRERIRQTFGRVVAPRVRDQLLSDPSRLHLAGARREITTLFADVRGFTTFSETAEPEVLFTVLNSYLSLAAQAVLAEEGTIDKFMGDAVMALFNAPDPQPDHTLRAVRAALVMRDVLEAHRHLLDRTHRLYFGVGITVGEAIVGNVGTPELFNYTAIGDVVNLAKRLQEVARPGQIILSAEAYRRVAGAVVVNELPPVHLKGRQVVEIPFEVVRLV